MEIELPALNLPPCRLDLREEKGMVKVMCLVRRKLLKLTPEEYVRQSFVAYLVTLGYSTSLILMENPVLINGLHQRADIVVYDRTMKPYLIVECKATTVTLTAEVVQQALRYNIKLGVKYVAVTNGLQHYCFEIVGGECKSMGKMPEWPPVA
ncbi:MAG: type I restriction enzyme HsdR N-terminal domain-containing protein [Bacteroidales bacterium]|nr:type I restriction enzyme HsdR N-terminal domain-containing protein [Bacteroidales bacterium]